MRRSCPPPAPTLFDRFEKRDSARIGRRRAGRLIRILRRGVLQLEFRRPAHHEIPAAVQARGIDDRVIDVVAALSL